MMQAQLYSALRIHPDVLADTLLALRAIGGELSEDTKHALQELRTRANRVPTRFLDLDSIAILKSIDETIEAVRAGKDIDE